MARVLVVGKGTPDRGGIPTYVNWLLTSDIARRHDLSFLNLARDSGPKGGRLSASNVRRTLEDALSLWRMSRGFDVVHIHSALAPGVTIIRAGLLGLVARARGCKVLMHAHGGRLPQWMSGRTRRALVRAAFAPVHFVVVVSTGNLRTFTRILGPESVELIPNAVDVAAFRPTIRNHEVPRVLYVGSLTPRKGVTDLIQASRQLHAEAVAHELWLVGGTPDEGTEAEAEVRATADATVRFLGVRSHHEMPALFQSADVFCLPSWWEAMPLSILEAMASGLPVVATAVGDVPTMIRHGVTGFLVEAHQPDEIASSLRMLLDSVDLRARLGAAGRRDVEQRFDAAAAITRLDDLYERMCKS